MDAVLHSIPAHRARLENRKELLAVLRPESTSFLVMPSALLAIQLF